MGYERPAASIPQSSFTGAATDAQSRSQDAVFKQNQQVPYTDANHQYIQQQQQQQQPPPSQQQQQQHSQGFASSVGNSFLRPLAQSVVQAAVFTLANDATNAAVNDIRTDINNHEEKRDDNNNNDNRDGGCCVIQ